MTARSGETDLTYDGKLRPGGSVVWDDHSLLEPSTGELRQERVRRVLRRVTVYLVEVVTRIDRVVHILQYHVGRS